MTQLLPACIKTAVPLASYTTLKVGGEAEYFATVATNDELETVITWAKTNDIGCRVIGGGSNILVSDSGVAGLVIQLNYLERKSQLDSKRNIVLATFGAGVMFDDCVAETVKEGWWGLENLSHIPGTVGATPIQNVGAYGVEVADLIEYVTVYDTQAERVLELTAEECEFGYRTSRFKTNDAGRYIVLSVTFCLHLTARPVVTYKDLAFMTDVTDLTPTQVRTAVIKIRAGKFPDWQVVGTAGSFFKNPIISTAKANALLENFPELPVYPVDKLTTKVSLGYILDKICQLRGYQVGRVRLYEQQALVLVAESGATAAQVSDFADYIADKVYEATGIKIEREVMCWK